VATQQRLIDYLIEEASGGSTVSAKPMFGEFGVYVDGKMIGSVCGDQLFLKPTASAASMPDRFLKRPHIPVPNRS
jgi:TfoX/Sxy family transcriptional regulator of competence genes